MTKDDYTIWLIEQMSDDELEQVSQDDDYYHSILDDELDDELPFGVV